jgi:hypothetical protein
MLPSACNDSVGALIALFRSSIPIPPIPLFMLRRPPRGDQRKTRGRADRYSFLVRLSHSLRHAGLSRRSITLLPRYSGLAATVSSSIAFPVAPVIRSTLLPQFLEGTRTVSPVAQHVLAIVPALPPRRSDLPRQPVCGLPCSLHPERRDSAFGNILYRGYLWVHSIPAR